jgi:hypothetical protein
MRFRIWAAVIALLIAVRAPAAQPRELWLYCPTNLLVDANIDKLDKLWHRAAAAGYSHVLLSDSKFSRLGALGSNTAHYMANIERTKRLARDNHLTLIPAVFPIGYSNDLLSRDPNLAEGLPVRDTPFVVRNNVATVDADPAVSLSKIGFKDDVVHVAGTTATMDPTDGNARMTFKLKLPKFRCYHVSVQVKTAGFHGDAKIMALAPTGPLNFDTTGFPADQDWTTVDSVFDTLDQTDVTLYFGVWGGLKGSLQWRNWKIVEAGLVNVLRRAGTPCTVAGRVEGRGYDRIEDSRLGDGDYTVWHEPPVIRTHGIADGTVLKVSWFYPPIISGEQVGICLSDPKTIALLTEQARLMKAAFGPPGYMMNHDEIRCMNWDEACESRHLDAGAELAENLRTCTHLLGDSDKYVWSDMFDPFHNARDHFYLVRGDLKNSWAGLDPSVTVVNWNFEHRDESLKFFADRGNKQIIAGYYDGDVDQIKQWIASADKVPGVTGIMYTTWAHHYEDLEAFAKLCRE